MRRARPEASPARDPDRLQDFSPVRTFAFLDNPTLIALALLPSLLAGCCVGYRNHSGQAASCEGGPGWYETPLCFGYYSTCWRPWPEECPNCPPHTLPAPPNRSCRGPWSPCRHSRWTRCRLRYNLCQRRQFPLLSRILLNRILSCQSKARRFCCRLPRKACCAGAGSKAASSSPQRPCCRSSRRVNDDRLGRLTQLTPTRRQRGREGNGNTLAFGSALAFDIRSIQ